MVEVFVLMAYMGGFCMLFVITDIFVAILAFIIYKLDNGKKNFWQFMKRWEF